MPADTRVEPRPIQLATRLQEVARKTRNEEVKGLLMDGANELVNAWESLKAVETAIDAASERKRGLLDRIRKAIGCAPDVTGEFAVLEEAAQWCEIVASADWPQAQEAAR